MSQLLSYLWYPVFFGAAVLAYGLALSAQVTPAVAAYPPVILVGLGILLLEWNFPERLDWRPSLHDVRADAAFMAVVQIFIPRALAALLVIILAEQLSDRSAGVWPHHWPLIVQVIAMVLTVDFFRYWLHRACHVVTPLWKLHEVHHSPDILYVLNVGRFHPLEKALHFLFDTLPFVFLGAGPEVLAGYFLAYSVNGFFQHSNVRLRYGFLNYLVGSAETHRWHHARDPKVAHCNFGNTTIIWDLIFGTWFLPTDGRMLDIGITDRSYPRGFMAQMIAPFRGSGERRDFRRWLADRMVSVSLRLSLFLEGLRLAKMLRDPMREQRKLLTSILRDNADAKFGRKHGFSGISDIESLRSRVPVSDFEALRPYIEGEIVRGEAALTEDAPVRYLRTSGSTGRAKDVPLTLKHLQLLKRIHRLAVASQHRACPAAFEGSILAIVSPRQEGVLENGKPYGSASGIVSGNTPKLVRAKFVLPYEVLAIEDSRLKYLTILRLALARRDLTYIGSANPTTLLALMKLYSEHRAVLIGDLRNGGFFLADRLPQSVLEAISPQLFAVPARASELDQLADGQPRIAELWPALRGVMIWTCGSAGVAAAAVKRQLDHRTRILELGYVASEFRGTVTLGRRPESGLPTLFAHFFEFVERDLWDLGEPRFLTLDQLRKGIDYYVIVTTPSGLYRYFINDIVRVTGYLHRTPLLKFVQKGRGVTSITGEKLYEGQVLQAIHGAAADIGLAPRFFQMLADERAQLYRLYVEADHIGEFDIGVFGAAVDSGLQAINVEYAAKRESGRLAPVSAVLLQQGTFDAYKQHCVSRGQRESQFKAPVLALLQANGFDFEGWRIR